MLYGGELHGAVGWIGAQSARTQVYVASNRPARKITNENG